ncbi:MAG: AEC family transporter [Firmicutes bacterium]|nr:AEC family transporter [Bacillota bacterium]
MQYSVLLQQIIIIFAIAAVGFIAFKCGLIQEEGNRAISKLVLYITLPAMIIASVADVPPNLTAGDILFFLFLSFISYAVMGLIGFFIPRLLKAERKDYGVYTFVTMFGNVGFMGFPILSTIFGPQAVFIAAIFNLPMNLLSFTLGVLMLAPRGTKLQMKEFFTPAVVTSFIAPLLYLLPITIPTAIYDGFSLLGSATVPLGMFIIGSSIAQIPFKQIWNLPKLYVVSAAKLLICPIALWLIFKPFVHDPLIFGIAVALGMMPSATCSTMLCIEYGGNELLASRTVCISTILSAVTIPVMIFLLL